MNLRSHEEYVRELTVGNEEKMLETDHRKKSPEDYKNAFWTRKYSFTVQNSTEGKNYKEKQLTFKKSAKGF